MRMSECMIFFIIGCVLVAVTAAFLSSEGVSRNDTGKHHRPVRGDYHAGDRLCEIYRFPVRVLGGGKEIDRTDRGNEKRIGKEARRTVALA